MEAGGFLPNESLIVGRIGPTLTVFDFQYASDPLASENGADPQMGVLVRLGAEFAIHPDLDLVIGGDLSWYPPFSHHRHRAISETHRYENTTFSVDMGFRHRF